MMDSERELFTKSLKLFKREVRAEDLVRHDKGVVHELMIKEPARPETLMDHATVSLSQMQRSEEHAAAATKPAAAAVSSSHPTKSKRPLWGARKWPSYYDNVLRNKNGSFKADAPTHTDAALDRGDDDQAIESDKAPQGTQERCTMDSPCLHASRVPSAPEERKGPSGPAVGAASKRGRVQSMWQQVPAQPSVQRLKPAERNWLLKKLGIATRAADVSREMREREMRADEMFRSRVVSEEKPLVTMASEMEAIFKRDVQDQAHERADLEEEAKDDSLKSREAVEKEERRMNEELALEKKKLVLEVKTRHRKPYIRNPKPESPNRKTRNHASET